MIYDTIIVGGGIGGMTAAIYAARANLSVLLLEKHICGGLVNMTHVIENYPSYKSIGGIELMEQTKEQVEALGVVVEEVSEVERVDLLGDVKTIYSDDGEEFQGKTVIFALGRTPRSLDFGCFEENIHYCAICDGTAYKNKDVIVVGGGNAGFDESIYLSNLGVSSVHIIEFMDSCIADASTQDKAFTLGNISAETSTSIESIEVVGKKGIVTLKNNNSGETYTKEVAGVFIFIGQEPNTQVLKNVLTLDKQGYIVTDADMKTSVAGVYAAGDSNSKKYRQITTAMSDGTIAALEVTNYLS